MTEEFSIRFRAVEGSPLIEQMPSHGATLLTVPKEHPEQGPLRAVRVNGVSKRFRITETGQAAVAWFPLQGGYIELVCVRPKEPLKLPQDRRTTNPLPRPEYGLQRPIQPRSKETQWST